MLVFLLVGVNIPVGPLDHTRSPISVVQITDITIRALQVFDTN